MSSRRFVVTLVAVLFGIILILGPALSGIAAEPKKIRVGLLVGLTGWFSAAGNADLNECKAAADLVNERGGVKIKGEKYLIELVPEDMKSSNEGTTAAVNKLIYDKKVQFIVGPLAFWASASAPLCEANKMINLTGFCANTPGELDKTTKHRILAENGTMGHVYALIKFIKKNHPEVKSVVVVNPDDGGIPYSKALWTKALGDSGMTMAGDIITYANELVDFSPIAAKIAARKADAIFHVNGIGPQVSPIVKGLREQGDERWYFHAGMTRCPDIKKLAGAGARKVVTLAVTPGAPGNTPQMEEFIKKVYAKFADPKDQPSLIIQNSTAVWVLPQILQAANSLDAKEILKALPKMDKIETLMGPGRMGGEKTYGIKQAVTHPLPSQIIDEKGDIKFGGYITDIVVP
jgi:branched-chain amino acid transport system substrate-binding protein